MSFDFYFKKYFLLYACFVFTSELSIHANSQPANLIDFIGLQTAFYNQVSGHQYLQVSYKEALTEKPKVGFLRLGLAFLKVKNLRILLDTRWVSKSRIVEIFDKIVTKRGIRFALAEKIQLVVLSTNGDNICINGAKGKFTAGGNLQIWGDVEVKIAGVTNYFDSANLGLDPSTNSLLLCFDGEEQKITFEHTLKNKLSSNEIETP